MNSAQFASLFPLGSHLCREPMPPMSELKRDMENLKRHGFNLIKLQEHWMTEEPLEGHYDFSRYEELIEHAGRLDLGVYLGLTCEQAPGWLWRKHPGCRMVGRDGVPVAYEAVDTLLADGKPGPCYDHPGARADMVRFIRELVRVLGRYENLVVWNTWQEVGYWSESLVGQPVCYCEHTLAYWREWLQEKYGDLDGLNRAWNTRYGDWSYVLPMRSARPNCVAQEVDWAYFMANVQMARVLRTRAEAIREADPLRRPVFAHLGGPDIGSGAGWTYARCQDFLGCSCYPAWTAHNSWYDDGRPLPNKPADPLLALQREMWDKLALTFDYMRSANRPGAPVWAAEFQGGPFSMGLHKGRVPSPADMRRWMLTAVGSGVSAISFWVTRAEIAACETDGFSLLDSEGDSTPRLEEAARIGRALNRHAGLFGQPSKPPAEVAVVIDEWAHCLLTHLEGASRHHTYSVRGWYRMLWEAGIPVDFVEAAQLDGPRVAGYKALILPFPFSISEEVAGKLVRYVEQGGHLISEACPGRLNEHAYANRGELSPALRALFGVRQLGVSLVREPENGSRWSPLECSAGEYVEAAMLAGTGPLAGQAARANLYLETLACEGAVPCLLHGDAVAGTVCSVGRGQAWLLGTFLGHSGTAYRDERTPACVRALLAHCGVSPAHQGKLLLRKRAGEGKEAWLFTNPTAEEITERIDVGGWGRVEDLLGEPLPREGNSIEVAVSGLDVRVLVLERL